MEVTLFFNWLIKNPCYDFQVYFKDVHPKFPEGGKMSQYLENMKIGETIDVRGPSGRLQYANNGTFLIKKLKKDAPTKIVARKLNMIAGECYSQSNQSQTFYSMELRTRLKVHIL